MFETLEKKTIIGAAALAAALVSSPSPAEAQVAFGAQVAATEFVEGKTTWGYGARAMVQIPGLGLGVQGTYDVYDQDCEEGSCDLKEIGLNVVWTIPLPIMIHPYLGGGVALETLDGSGVEVDTEEYREHVLAGLSLNGPTFRRFRPFGEVRYELEEKRTTFSGGILLYLF